MSDTLSPMQEQLLAQASNILQSVTDTVSKAADFASTQIPDIALQYVAYGRVTATGAFLFGVLGAILLAWILISVCFNNTYKITDAEGRGFLAFLSMMLIGIPSFGFIFGNFNSMIMVWFAPKVWLIREIVQLVK